IGSENQSGVAELRLGPTLRWPERPCLRPIWWAGGRLRVSSLRIQRSNRPAWNPEGSGSLEICPSCGIHSGTRTQPEGDQVRRGNPYIAWREKWPEVGHRKLTKQEQHEVIARVPRWRIS